MIRFTVYDNNPVAKTRILMQSLDSEEPSDNQDYLANVARLMNMNDETSYWPGCNLLCFSADDGYNGLYHSPVFNLSKSFLQKDREWFNSELGYNRVFDGLRELYTRDYCGSQKAVLNHFLAEEQSISSLQMFDQKSTTAGFRQFLNPGLIASSLNYTIYELPPTYKLIQYYFTNRESIDETTILKTDRIPLPWQVYVAVHDNNYNLIDTFMYFSKDSILKNGFEQPVFVPFLPNFYSNGLLCRPFYANYDDVSRYGKSISGIMHASYDAVWNSGWNFDLYDTLMENLTNLLKDRNNNQLKYNLKSKNLDYVYENMILSIAKSSSPMVRFAALVNGISLMTPEDMLSFPYISPSYDQLYTAERERWVEQHYENFMENLDLTEEEREDSSYVQDLFENYLSEQDDFDRSERSFGKIFTKAIDTYCRKNYSLMFTEEGTSSLNSSSNQDTYSRLFFYFQNTFYSK